VNGQECRLCLGPCEPEIHAATERVRAWLRERIAEYLAPVEAGVRVKRPRWGSDGIGVAREETLEAVRSENKEIV
jgi:hypothetical protein